MQVALAKLREGMGNCIIHGIGAPPGSSPAIPASLKMTSTPGYSPGPRDWKTPVWTCAHFSVDGPMRFQVQWQLIKPRLEGRGIAWVDDDGDGNADRAFAFSVTMKARREPVLGEVGPIEASHPLVSFGPP